MTTFDDQGALLAQAAHCQRQGRFPEAIAAYERLLNRWPDRPDSWYNLARLQSQVGRLEEALASYRQALVRGVSQPEEVHLNCSVILADGLRRYDEAQRALDAALACNPHYGLALLNLATINEIQGRRDQALGLYQRLLAVDDNCHEGLARYAALRGVASADDPLLARLRQRAQRRDISALDRASLSFALGKLLDGCLAYDRAFEAYTEANGQVRAYAASVGLRYDRRSQERYVNQLISAFSRAPKASATLASRAPIFICGMFRSGSTLTEQVLAAHSRVQAGGELGFLPHLTKTRLAPYPATVAGLSTAELDRIAGQYREALALAAPGAERVTDKRPDNFEHIGLIKTLFPDARIVHTTRNPLDNALSVYFLNLDPALSYAQDLGDIGHCYGEYRRLMAHWKSLYGDDILDVDYDALVQDPKPAVQRLLAFCGLDWEDGCLSFETSNNAVRTASVWQVRRPFYRESSGRWRHYASHLGPLREALGPLGEAGR